MARNMKGDFCYDNAGNALLEFFAKAGSCFAKKKSHYGEEASALDLFKPAFAADEFKAIQLMFWLRDCRGGSGNRSGFRSALSWVAQAAPKWVKANLHLVPFVGRWDDLEALVGTECEAEALAFWVEAIRGANGLAAKWAPRGDKNKEVFNKLRKVAGMPPKDFRKLLVANSKTVETLMCSGDFGAISYNGVPSVAAARYNKAFERHDATRYGQWKADLESGKTKVNASVLFPHDVLRTLRAGGDSEKLANAQFAALPDYMADKNARIMPICDFSGSMETNIGGSIEAIDVSLSLGLYCSDRLGRANPFYRMFIPFSDDSRLVSWQNMSFSEAAESREINDGFCGSTNIAAALRQILRSAKMFKAKDSDMPTHLLIISDMQFDQGVEGNETTVETCMKEWEKAGYSRPKVVYWNTSSYAGSVATELQKDVALVSGFSPSLLKAILTGDSFDPVSVMNRALEKYEVVKP